MTPTPDPKAPTAAVSLDKPQATPASAQLASRLAQDSAGQPATPIAADCSQTLWLSVFFDGTGNNMAVDVPTYEHSNVARLFRAMSRNSPEDGRLNFYVPGIGTPFREIGDEGGKLSMAVAGGGEARIQWAMDRVDREVKKAAARAQNPVNKIRSINISVFGFSRGAATARAFALRIADKCKRSGAHWVWNNGGYPTRLYFMGLFDTVASVGTPSGARKYTTEAVLAAPLAGFVPVFLAATADGHGAWASNLRIPEMVERCVHFCAAHEIRNSFPLDTLLDNGHYPSNCMEAYYPGVHSNVGGGYRPGEGGRNFNRFATVSLIPLRAMYEEAVKAGVPLQSLTSLAPEVRDDFLPTGEDNIKARATLTRRFNHYMSLTAASGRGVGETVRAHMRMYFRWRILHVGRKLLDNQHGKSGWDAQRLRDYDASLKAERLQQKKLLDQREQEMDAAEDARNAAWSWYCRGRTHDDRRVAYEEASRRYEDAKWAKVNQGATVATMPSDSGTLTAALDKFDKQFLEDSAKVRSADMKSLRPFARILREAWDMEALVDDDIIAFFDEYVTDSLAGFDSDKTRAVDPRWLYQGGDDMVDYAALQNGKEEAFELG